MQKNLRSSKTACPLTFAAVTILFFSACIGALCFPSAAARGVRSGIQYSLEVLLPSMFPFMFLSSFSTEYGISERLGKLLSRPVQFLFNLPGDAAVTVLLSLIGGYPVGAVGISSLLRKGRITSEQAERMLCFCVNPGPAFLISAVGDELYHNKLTGIIILASHCTASIFFGIILGLFSRRKMQPIKRTRGSEEPEYDFSSSFVNAARSACAAAVSLCSLVVLFSSFTALLLDLTQITEISPEGAFIRSLLEVTDGVMVIEKLRLPILFTSLAVGWGGLCVHFQVFAAIPELKIHKLRFFLSRLTVGAASAGITYLIIKYTDINISVFSNVEETAASLSSLTVYGSAGLFVSSVMFLLFLGGGKINKENRTTRNA